MAHEDTVLTIMESLVIADKHVIGDIMAHKGIWKAGTSAVNNSYKSLNALVDLGKLEKTGNYFRLPGCRSEGKEHAMALTAALVDIIKLKLDYVIFREPTIKEISLRPDAIVYLSRGDKALCFILEICLNETEDYLRQKINAWKHYERGKEVLSEILGTRVKAFDIVVSGQEAEGAFEFKSYLEALK